MSKHLPLDYHDEELDMRDPFYQYSKRQKNYEHYDPDGLIKDNVNSPPHYKQDEDSLECIDALEQVTKRWKDGSKAYLHGAVFKYIWRCTYKGKLLEDLKKSEWYLKRLIKAVERDGEDY